jgi:hypothetical protein
MKKQLEKYYKEAGIDPTAKPDIKKKNDITRITKMFSSSTLSSPKPVSIVIYNDVDEEDNPTYDEDGN